MAPQTQPLPDERAGNRLIVALDMPSAEAALAAVRMLRGVELGMVKIGKELFAAAGPDLVRRVVGEGFSVFLDLKFHDIPNTVAGAVRACGRLGVSLLNVHASGGLAMMRSAVAAARESGPAMRVIAVTVLTSLSAEDLHQTGVAASPREQALRLAALAATAGMDGVVASSQETAAIRAQSPKPFLIVAPGIRPQWAAAAGDQKRVATPSDAMAAGADYIVVGRPVTQAPDPAEAARRIIAELESARLPR